MIRSPEMRKPKRPRALQACAVCRVRKNRCSEDQPCTYCVEHDLECTYTRVNRDRRTTSTKSSRTTSNIQMQERQYASPAIDLGQMQQHDPPSIQSTLDGNTLMAHQSTIRSGDSASDVMDTNPHTSNLEFYGGSSSVAFLRHVESISNSHVAGSVAVSSERSLASLLHNTEFRPTSTQRISSSGGNSRTHADRFYFRVAQRFLDAYFSNIHLIQPLFDEDSFLSRCESLWFDSPEQQPLSFVALYYATLSLGSLVMACEDWDKHGSKRFTWSRKLLDEALSVLNQLGSATDVEMAQCYYMISKVFQHELNPHVAYLYSGQAARTALAIGINRKPIDQKASDPRSSITASKTWWAIYCQDIQTSFALGRPDSLGPDEYHTQSLPVTLSSDEANSSPANGMLQIVPCMVELSRIMRNAGLRLYAAPCSVGERLSRVEGLESDLECWQKSLPVYLQSVNQKPAEQALKLRHSATYIHKQSIVLHLRYLNLRMIIHGVFMGLSEPVPPDQEASVRESRKSCLNSACRAIDLIYDTFANYSFFQTWWYNSTYTLFAVSILLSAIFHNCARTSQALDDIFAHIDRAIAVLEAMDECIVARNAICHIKRTLSRAKGTQQRSLNGDMSHNPQEPSTELSMSNGITPLQGVGFPNILSDVEVEGAAYGGIGDGLTWPETNPSPFDDCQQALFWTTWAQEVDVLGI